MFWFVLIRLLFGLGVRRRTSLRNKIAFFRGPEVGDEVGSAARSSSVPRGVGM